MDKWTRLALIAVIAAQPVVALAQDEVTETPVERPQVVLDADKIFVDDERNIVTAEGNVEAEYEGRVMRADRLIYDQNNDTVRATGNVIILDPDGTQRFADEIETNSSLDDGYAIGFSTRMPNGGLVAAASAARSSSGTNAMDKVIYTSCKLCEGQKRPTWALRARRATLNQESQMITYRDAVLEVGGFPVFYMPYFAHPDPNSDRRSGLLPPDFGTSSRLGLFYQQPYYWAISPSQDLTISPKAMGKVNPLLELDYRKRFWSGQVNANVSFTNEFDFGTNGETFGEKEWRGHVFADGQFAITKNLKWGFGVERVTDDLYTSRYDIDGENNLRGLYSSQPRRLLSQLYVQGQTRNGYADVSVLNFDGLRAFDDDDTFPTALPLLFAEQLFDFGDNGLLAVNASTAILSRRTGIDSHRASFGSDWSTTRILPGGFVLNPFAEARYDYYKLNDAPSGRDEFSRGVATVGSRLSYPLYRPGSVIDILIEPEIMAAFATPGDNNSDIPVEDSLFYEADESTLFDASAVGGYDLYEGGSKAAFGISATARWKNGVSLTALGGRRWRDRSETAFSTASNLDGTVSDWVAGLSANFGNPLKIETRVRLDDEDLTIKRVDARLKSRWGRLDGQVRYYRVDSDITSTGFEEEGVDVRAQVRVTDNYYVVYNRQRDLAGSVLGNGTLTKARDLRHSFGIAYEDDCSRFEISFERSEAVDRTLGANDSIKFRFSLKTLGDFGSNDLD